MKPPSRSQRATMRTFATIVALLVGLLVWRIARPVSEHVWTGTFMGQPYTIIVQDRAVNTGMKQMMDINLPQMLIQMETHFSSVPGLGIAAEFNSSTSTLPVYVGSELWRAVNLHKRFSQSTAAADITIAHLYDIWDRVRAGKIPPLSTHAALDLLRDAGMERLMAPAEGYIRKLRPNLSINVDSAAQGYTADRIEIFMIEKKISHFHAQIGGTVISRGMPHLSARFPINFAPGAPPAVTSLVHLGSAQMATRGPGDGFHQLDPRTGMPVTNSVHSVTVIAESAMIASSMATILHILGPEQGLRWLDANGIARGRALYFVNVPGKGLLRARSLNFPVDAEQIP